MSVEKIRRLQIAIDAFHSMCLAEHSAAAAVEKELGRKIDLLRAAKSNSIDLMSQSGGGALLVTKHHRWIDQTIRALNLELAKSRAALEMARGKLMEATAKREVLKKLNDGG